MYIFKNISTSFLFMEMYYLIYCTFSRIFLFGKGWSPFLNYNKSKQYFLMCHEEMVMALPFLFVECNPSLKKGHR